jgi:hypothetical protein
MLMSVTMTVAQVTVKQDRLYVPTGVSLLIWILDLAELSHFKTLNVKQLYH